MARMILFENPEKSGFFYLGQSDELAELNHTGWTTGSKVDGLARGAVYQISARHGRDRYIPCVLTDDHLAPYHLYPSMVYESENEGGNSDHQTESEHSEQSQATEPASKSDNDAIVQCAIAADELADQFAQQERRLIADWDTAPAEQPADDDFSPDPA